MRINGTMRERQETQYSKQNHSVPAGCGGTYPSAAFSLLDVSHLTRLRRSSLASGNRLRAQRGLAIFSLRLLDHVRKS